jgi:hypothetical protein
MMSQIKEKFEEKQGGDDYRTALKKSLVLSDFAAIMVDNE